MATVKLVQANVKKAPLIALLFASSGIESEIVAEAEPVEFMAGLTLPVARTSHLIALKVLSRNDVTAYRISQIFARCCGSRPPPTWPTFASCSN